MYMHGAISKALKTLETNSLIGSFSNYVKVEQSKNWFIQKLMKKMEIYF